MEDRTYVYGFTEDTDLYLILRESIGGRPGNDTLNFGACFLFNGGGLKQNISGKRCRYQIAADHVLVDRSARPSEPQQH